MIHSAQPSPEAVQAALTAAHGPGVVTSGVVVWCNYAGVATADVARTLQGLGFSTRERPMTPDDIARVEGWMVPPSPEPQGTVGTFALTDVMATAERALGVKVGYDHAGGGCVALLAETADGYAVTITEESSPFLPDRDGRVAVGGFLLTVTPGGRDAYLAGTDAEYFLEVLPTLDALATALPWFLNDIKGGNS